MNILVTGAAGFLGRNLVENLKNIRDGKNKTRPNIIIHNIYEFDVNNSLEELESFCKDCDFVFNLAGINRTTNSKEFEKVNYGFASVLLDNLRKFNNKCPVMLSSSIQATLLGRYGISDYGLSKRDGEELFFDYSLSTGATVYVYRFPNLAGKWIKPNYNSAVATFCNNIANDLPITVNDKNTEIELAFVDDLLEELYDALEGKPHRAEYPKSGEIFDGVEYDGLTPMPVDTGKYCYVSTTYKVSLGRIVELLELYHNQSRSLVIPRISDDSFEKKLYSMYLSYLPKDKIAFPLKMNTDDRGTFTELLKTVDHGQISINISKPGVTKGQHWHNSKWEIFFVVSGHGLIQERKIGTDEVIEIEVDGSHIQAVHMLPGYTHNIINLSDSEELITVMWANEIFDSNRPDTFFEMV